MPNTHAKLCTPSSSERWLNCTAAPRYEELFPASTTVYAEEGTLAHSVCELHGKKWQQYIKTRYFNSQIKQLKEHELWDDEMLKTAEFYIDFLKESANRFNSKPHVAFEVRVDLSDYIPECFGTCDCIMIGDGVLRIVDYKHGKGVKVSSENNPQMRLYALGALKRYESIYGDTIQDVYMAIVQPRITEDVSEDHMTVDDLKRWGREEVIPKAQAAYLGLGTFKAGEWCRFCRGAAECRARAEYYAGFESVATKDPRVLTPDEVGEYLVKAAALSQWYSDLQDHAQKTILNGEEIPGWKVVEGKAGNRTFTNADEAFERMKNNGYKDAVLYERKPKTLTQLEKMVGKKDFAEMMKDLIFRPKGKPTLVKESDKRESYSKAPDGSEFQGVT